MGLPWFTMVYHMTLVDTICHMAIWFTMVYYDIDWVDLAHKICRIFGIHICTRSKTHEKNMSKLSCRYLILVINFNANSTALKLREKIWSLDAAFDPQISRILRLSPSSAPFQSASRETPRWSSRCSSPAATTGQRGQKRTENPVNNIWMICEYHEFRWFQNSSDTFWH